MASRKQQYALLLSDNIVVSLVSIVNGISVEIPWFFPLLHQLVKATLCRKFSQATDKLGWISSTNGSFDPQNAYKMATANPHIVSNFSSYWIWNIPTLSKIQLFFFGNACKIVYLSNKYRCIEAF